MQSTTPEAITSTITEVCADVVGNPVLQYINFLEVADAEVGQCYFNVLDQVSRSGGHCVFGWTVWEVSSLYVELEHHAVWSDSNGVLFDITPKIDGEKQILFLHDSTAGFSVRNPKFRDNKRFSVSPDARVHRFLRAAEKRNKFILRHSVLKQRVRQTSIPNSHTSLFRAIEQELHFASLDLETLAKSCA